MPERAINTKSATGCLLVLIPAALTMSALFVAWPVILGVTLLLAGGNIWQSNEWSKTARSIDPIFQQSIVQYRGEISPLDLSLNANVSGAVAHRYLAARAAEFGTGSRQHPDRGQVYYFVSIGTLGSILDDSELSEPETPVIMPATNPVMAFQSTATATEFIPEVLLQPQFTPAVVTSAPSDLPITPIPSSQLESFPPQVVAPESIDLPELVAETPTPAKITDTIELEQLPIAAVPTTTSIVEVIEAEQLAISTETILPTDRPVVTIIQSELAKRLDVHSSTVYKRRSEPNFTDWTRNRDPDGIAWGYAETTKEYYRVEES
jgi:hypothetical protein